MPPQPRQRTKLGKNRPGGPSSSDQHEQQPDESAPPRGRAGVARTGARDSGGERAGIASAGAQDPTPENPSSESAGSRDPEPERVGAASTESREPEGAAGEQVRGGRRVQWTADAKAMRAELAAWSAARRKLAEREVEVRRLITSGRVPEADARAIVARAAEATGEPVEEVARAAGLDPAAFER